MSDEPGAEIPLDPYRDSHVHPKLRRQVFDICEGITLCLSHEPRMAIPALIQLYAGIDGMAWISIADGRPDVTGGDFRAWTMTYFLPDAGLECDEHDLWAARCALVHTQTMDSRHVREGKARHIWYYVGPGNRFLIPLHPGYRHEEPITVHIDALADAFRKATDRFFDAIERDSDLEKRIWPRAEQYYDEVRAHGKPGEDGSWVETIPTIYR